MMTLNRLADKGMVEPAWCELEAREVPKQTP
jgi:hypothetical protein